MHYKRCNVALVHEMSMDRAGRVRSSCRKKVGKPGWRVTMSAILLVFLTALFETDGKRVKGVDSGQKQVP